MKKILLILLLVFCQPTIASEQADWQLVGETRLKVMFWSVYDARLYSLDGLYDDSQRPLKLELAYLRKISKQALLDRTAKEWRDLGYTDTQIEQWLPRLEPLWSDVGPEDSLAVVLDNNNTCRFYGNGKATGSVPDATLCQAFLDIWLSPKTSQPANREALIGIAAQ